MATPKRARIAVREADAIIQAGLRLLAEGELISRPKLIELVELAKTDRAAALAQINAVISNAIATAVTPAMSAAPAALAASAEALRFGGIAALDYEVAEALARGWLTGEIAFPGTAPFAGISQIEARAAKKIQSAVATGMRLGYGVDQIADAVAEVAGAARAAAYAVTNTAVQSSYRAAQVSAVLRVGLERFIYVGPDDDVTRPFCADLVGEEFTADEIREMDNGQGLDVFTSGGGYNCRHAWVPVVPGIDDDGQEDDEEE